MHAKCDEQINQILRFNDHRPPSIYSSGNCASLPGKSERKQKRGKRGKKSPTSNHVFLSPSFFLRTFTHIYMCHPSIKTKHHAAAAHVGQQNNTHAAATHDYSPGIGTLSFVCTSSSVFVCLFNSRKFGMKNW